MSVSRDVCEPAPPRTGVSESSLWDCALYLYKRENVLLVLTANDRRPGALGLERRQRSQGAGAPAADTGGHAESATASVWVFWAPYESSTKHRELCQTDTARVSPEDKATFSRRHGASQPLDRGDPHAFSVCVGDLLALRRHLPAIGSPRVCFTKKGGEMLPELAFQEGGLRDFLSALRRHIELEPDSTDPDLFYVRAAIADDCPRSRKASNVQISNKGFRVQPRTNRRFSASPAAIAMLVQEQPSHIQSGPVVIPQAPSANPRLCEQQHRHASEASSPSAVSGSSREDSIFGTTLAAEEELTFHLLERFAQITRLARTATSSLSAAYRQRRTRGRRTASSTVTDDANPNAASKDNEYPAVSEDATSDEPLASVTVQYENGEIIPPLRTLDRDFARYRPLRAAAGVSREAFQRGRRLDPLAMRRAIFAGGLEEDARADAWPYLLGVFDWTISPEEEQEQRSRLEKEYVVLREQWRSISEKQERRFTKYRDRRAQIEKDVVRTDRNVDLFRNDDSVALSQLFNILLTHAFFNFDLGYCQGMSDLAAPIVYVLGAKDEALAFWCFAALMDVLERNFRKDQSGMNEELARLAIITKHIDGGLYEYLKQQQADNFYFCYRWLLVRFKREFPFEQVLYLWDVMWAAPGSVGGGLFHLYVAAALLELHRDVILQYRLSADELFSYASRMAMRNDAELVIAKAETLFKEFGLPAEIELQLTQKRLI